MSCVGGEPGPDPVRDPGRSLASGTRLGMLRRRRLRRRNVCHCARRAPFSRAVPTNWVSCVLVLFKKIFGLFRRRDFRAEILGRGSVLKIILVGFRFVEFLSEI